MRPATAPPFPRRAFREQPTHRLPEGVIGLSPKGLDVLASKDGIYIGFTSPNGRRHAMIHIEAIAFCAAGGNAAREIVLQWAAEKQAIARKELPKVPRLLKQMRA